MDRQSPAQHELRRPTAPTPDATNTTRQHRPASILTGIKPGWSQIVYLLLTHSKCDERIDIVFAAETEAAPASSSNVFGALPTRSLTATHQGDPLAGDLLPVRDKESFKGRILTRRFASTLNTDPSGISCQPSAEIGSDANSTDRYCVFGL
jgi:hypothetical protein